MLAWMLQSYGPKMSVSPMQAQYEIDRNGKRMSEPGARIHWPAEFCRSADHFGFLLECVYQNQQFLSEENPMAGRVLSRAEFESPAREIIAEAQDRRKLQPVRTQGSASSARH
jgi:hypothetical protein